MADKEVIIGTDEAGMFNVMWGTGVKGSPDTSVTSTPTFSGTIVDGTDKIPYTLEIDRLRYDKASTHMALSRKLDDMLVNPDDITVIDTVRPKGEKPYQVIDHYFGCIVDGGNGYEIKVDDKTAESLKFKCEGKEREYKYLDGTAVEEE